MSKAEVPSDVDVASIEILNDDCIRQICTYLELIDQWRLAETSERFYAIVESIWHVKYTDKVVFESKFNRHNFDSESLGRLVDTMLPMVTTISGFNYDLLANSKCIYHNIRHMFVEGDTANGLATTSLDIMKRPLPYMANLNNFPNLHTLHITRAMVSSRQIQTLQKLKHLCIYKCNVDRIERFLYIVFTKLTKLRTLSLRLLDCDIFLQCNLKLITLLQYLEELQMDFHQFIRFDAIVLISSLKRLKCLTLHSCNSYNITKDYVKQKMFLRLLSTGAANKILYAVDLDCVPSRYLFHTGNNAYQLVELKWQCYSSIHNVDLRILENPHIIENLMQQFRTYISTQAALQIVDVRNNELFDRYLGSEPNAIESIQNARITNNLHQLNILYNDDASAQDNINTRVLANNFVDIDGYIRFHLIPIDMDQ